MTVADTQTLNQRFETAHPQSILEWAVDTYKSAIVTSFQPTGIVTIHMMSQIAPDIPVITLDTGLLFPETYALIDQLEHQLNLNLHRLHPQQQAENNLWQNDPDRCCYIRKVQPLQNALVDYDLWIAGLRRDQSARRAYTPIIAWDERHNMLKLCPFANWTESMIWTYIHAHDLPYNTLHDRGFKSIGCQPCTRAVDAWEDARAGRWSNHTKTECGLHI